MRTIWELDVEGRKICYFTYLGRKKYLNRNELVFKMFLKKKKA
jgi:hypothetical protein